MTFNSLADNYTLNNGVKIPILGFGTWQTPDGEVAKKAVLTAINSGYRLIDTAAAYGNEESVGEAIGASGINRHELFVTSKLWNSDHGYRQAKRAIDTSLDKLGLDYLDLYLIHWPNPAKLRAHWAELNSESWRAMEEAVRDGRLRAIGVSNFRRNHLDELLKTANTKPAVNQNYLNPSDMQPDLTDYNAQLGILNEAYSPLGTGGLLGNNLVTEIANNYHKTPAQLLIRWSLQHNFLPLPKSVHDRYIKSNLEVFDFKISPADMESLDRLHGVAAVAKDPDKADF